HSAPTGRWRSPSPPELRAPCPLRHAYMRRKDTMPQTRAVCGACVGNRHGRRCNGKLEAAVHEAPGAAFPAQERPVTRVREARRATKAAVAQAQNEGELAAPSYAIAGPEA